MVGTRIEQAIEEQDWIDRAVDPIQGLIEPVLDRAPRLASVLHGDWLGHPLHAALTDLPVGVWFAGFVLDMAEVAGTRRLRRGADALHAIGLAGSMGAAVAGLADWSRTRGEARRVGFVHAVTNVVIAGLYGASLAARARRRRRLGITLSSAGYGLLLFSSWLGGELAYGLGIGVRREAFDRKARELAEGEAHGEPAVAVPEQTVEPIGF
jgi:uncharacterized membrane protein